MELQERIVDMVLSINDSHTLAKIYLIIKKMTGKVRKRERTKLSV